MDYTICHFEIPADDPERAATFYRELFGWDIVPWGPPEFQFWHVKTVPTNEKGQTVRPGVNGALMKKRHPQQPWANYIKVDDIDGFLAKALSLGAQVALPKTPVPGMGWFLYIKDTEDNILGFWQDDTAAALPG